MVGWLSFVDVHVWVFTLLVLVMGYAPTNARAMLALQRTPSDDFESFVKNVQAFPQDCYYEPGQRLSGAIDKWKAKFKIKTWLPFDLDKKYKKVEDRCWSPSMKNLQSINVGLAIPEDVRTAVLKQALNLMVRKCRFSNPAINLPIWIHKEVLRQHGMKAELYYEDRYKPTNPNPNKLLGFVQDTLQYVISSFYQTDNIFKTRSAIGYGRLKLVHDTLAKSEVSLQCEEGVITIRDAVKQTDSDQGRVKWKLIRLMLLIKSRFVLNSDISEMEDPLCNVLSNPQPCDWRKVEGQTPLDKLSSLLLEFLLHNDLPQTTAVNEALDKYLQDLSAPPPEIVSFLPALYVEKLFEPTERYRAMVTLVQAFGETIKLMSDKNIWDDSSRYQYVISQFIRRVYIDINRFAELYSKFLVFNNVEATANQVRQCVPLSEYDKVPNAADPPQRANGGPPAAPQPPKDSATFAAPPIIVAASPGLQPGGGVAGSANNVQPPQANGGPPAAPNSPRVSTVPLQAITFAASPGLRPGGNVAGSANNVQPPPANGGPPAAPNSPRVSTVPLPAITFAASPGLRPGGGVAGSPNNVQPPQQITFREKILLEAASAQSIALVVEETCGVLGVAAEIRQLFASFVRAIHIAATKYYSRHQAYFGSQNSDTMILFTVEALMDTFDKASDGSNTRLIPVLKGMAEVAATMATGAKEHNELKQHLWKTFAESVVKIPAATVKLFAGLS